MNTAPPTAGAPRRIRGLVVIAGIGIIACIFVFRVLTRNPAGAESATRGALPVPQPLLLLHETFDAPALDRAMWIETFAGDFKERTVDVTGGRLRLGCTTIGTDEQTVKFLGIRSLQAFSLCRETRISADLDWNHQFNGSYLSGGIVLSPMENAGNPLVGADWLKIEYVGVPPGKNGRMVISLRSFGRDQLVFTEGWPEVNRPGRSLAVQFVEIILRDRSFEVRENGQQIFESKNLKLSFNSAYVYLQMSSHCNYPPRQIYFDNIRISSLE